METRLFQTSNKINWGCRVLRSSKNAHRFHGVCPVLSDARRYPLPCARPASTPGCSLTPGLRLRHLTAANCESTNRGKPQPECILLSRREFGLFYFSFQQMQNHHLAPGNEDHDQVLKPEEAA